MIFTSNDKREARKEEKRILTNEFDKQRFKDIRKRIGQELKAQVYLYYDVCFDYYPKPFYVAEIIADEFEKIYMVARPNVKEIFEELERYLDE